MTSHDLTLTKRFVLPALAAGALLFAACGDDDDAAAPADDAPTETGGEAPSGGASGPVTIVDFEYDPVDITVGAGEEVSFTNEDSTAHTATASDGSFNTDSIAGGEDGSATAPDEPGEYPFICSFHPFMKGTLIVQ